MKTYFVSDLHFFHKNIVSFTDRGKFTTQENHTEWLIELWNQQVQKGDTVWHLGDFSFGNRNRTADVLRRLNGGIYFLKGNHDKEDDLDYFCYNLNYCICWYDYKEIKIQETPTVLFHFPVSAWHKQGYGSYHLHGHSHGHLKPEFQKGKILDVGLDSAIKLYGQPKFFDEDMIVEYMASKGRFVSDHHAER
jgi:calcineurin-like phosphoesterase family protein